ncbi:MAG: SbcC/MukB-like Walker B domain-containing protein, partial [Bacteroidota bacterium]|nr:SbcC/MukB-like Walker B domain-containing protein [Bacteroidota bacterium]
IGSLQNEVQRLKSDLERYLTLRTDLEKLNLRAQDIVEMKNLFRGNQFVNYISTVYLRNLCKTANERFYKLTRQKLNLELTEDNGFQVRDFMNEGKVRSVKTLSGGQTFQASLSLALSLADSIHKVSPGYENFFFLDEGFGTLDKDSLDIVFETLKSLKKENRIVGVISHVEDMQQEIATYLRVRNNETEGSYITPSWTE